MSNKNKLVPLINLLEKNSIYFKIKYKCIKITIIIPILDIYIIKYYCNSNYYIYINDNFFKKINEKELSDKYNKYKN